MAIYRMKFAPDVMVSECAKGTENYDSCRAEIFEKFLEYSFIGTGWADISLKHGMSDDVIRKVSQMPKRDVSFEDWLSEENCYKRN